VEQLPAVSPQLLAEKLIHLYVKSISVLSGLWLSSAEKPYLRTHFISKCRGEDPRA
jgi:hypothetical protein